MADNSKIEWTEASWNPVTGCTEVSPGCDHCYAKTFAERWRGTPGHHFENGFDVTIRRDKLDQPLRWTRPRRIFVNSMSDLFHDDVTDDYISEVFAVMAVTPQHTFQLLTKRHGRMRSLLNRPEFQAQVRMVAESLIESWGARGGTDLNVWPLRNVWVGVSVESQQWADIRIPALIATPAAVRWLSCEPLLGPVDLSPWLRPKPGCGFVDPEDGLCDHPNAATPECFIGSDCPLTGNTYGGIDWVIAGGESGPGARPMHPTWARELRDVCGQFGVPYFFKQWGAWTPADRDVATHLVQLDGKRVDRRDATVDNPYGQGSGLAQDLVDRGHAGWVRMRRVPKNAAGRHLDGRTHDDYPLAVAA